jgi:hypothetical protein
VKALGILVLLTAGVAALAVWDPFHLLVAPWFAGIAVGVAAVFLTWWLTRVVRGKLLRGLITTFAGLALLVWGALVWATITISPGLAVLEEVPGPPDSRLRLAIVEVQTWAVDGPTYSVRLRAGEGLLTQDSPVWVGLGEGARPAEVRFADGGTVEVVSSGGCGYRSTVNAVTLAVDPVHRPLRLDGC